MQSFLLVPVFFIIALFYSMAGLGGGTAYITAMVLTGIPKEIFPPVALACNLLVASQGFYHFKKEGHFKWRLFWPFALTSIPCAYIGGRLIVPEKVFIIIMAVALTLAAVRMIFWKNQHVIPSETRNLLNQSEYRRSFTVSRFRMTDILTRLAIGCILGLLAGITGIGGGIYLIPALLFLGWATPHEASAVASLFIVVNSIGGLAGQLYKGHFDWKFFLPLALAVVLGGFIGSKVGAKRLSAVILQRIVGCIMLIAVAKLISKLFE